MPKVTFQPSGITVEVAAGTTLFRSALKAGLPVAASCDEVFVCGKCNLKIVDGTEALSPQSQKERDLLRNQGRSESDRISCITRVVSDCVVSASYW